MGELTREDIVDHVEALTRDDIAAQSAAPTTTLLEGVPELGDVYIRRLSGADRDARDLWALKHAYSKADEKAGRGVAGNLRDDTQHVRSSLVAMALCDEAGERLFEHAKLADLKILSGMDGEALDYLYDEVCKRNGLGAEAEKKVAKNLPDDPSAEPGFDLPGQ